MTLKTIRNFTLILALLVLSSGIGYNFGKNSNRSNITYSSSSPSTTINNQGIDFTLFWTVWDSVRNKYFDKVKVDPQKMYLGAIAGMVKALDDPYTVFLTPDQNKETKQELSGKFDGIGAQLEYKDKKVVVSAPLKDTPADKAGIKPGDWIIKIDNRYTTDLSLTEAVSLIRGQRGTKVKLLIQHEKSKSPEEKEIVRDSIFVKSVVWNLKNNVAVLKLSQFGDESNAEWDKAVSEIVNSRPSVRGVVLDLRNNPGGYLNGSVYIASEFLKSGTVVIQEGLGQKQTYSVDRVGKLTDVPLVVLINRGSASASEIVAGAMQDYRRAKLVGETSFGKGTIQDAEDLDGGAGLHVTVAKWLTPNGRWINSTGLTPDFKVEMNNSDLNSDPQLEKAVEILTGSK